VVTLNEGDTKREGFEEGIQESSSNTRGRRQEEMSITTSQQCGRYKGKGLRKGGHESSGNKTSRGNVKHYKPSKREIQKGKGSRKGGQESSGRARGRRKGKMANTESIQQGIYNEE